MFTGRRYDLETGLYYYRARYYNPQIGRFLQTDPIGYENGINWYNYCGNNSVNCVDPSGTYYWGIRDLDPFTGDKIRFVRFHDDGSQDTMLSFDSIEDLINNRKNAYKKSGKDWRTDGITRLANNDEETYWALMMLVWLSPDPQEYKSMLESLDTKGVYIRSTTSDSSYGSHVVKWNPEQDTYYDGSMACILFPHWLYWLMNCDTHLQVMMVILTR